MILDQHASIAAFLEAASAKQPTPGGGAVAALSGALACSMLEMVLNYSVNKKGLEAHRPALQSALDQATTLRKSLQDLIQRDQSAYLELTEARKLPESPDRAGRVEAALATAIDVPREIAGHCLRVLELADEVVELVNPWLLSDLAVCADLAIASVRSGVYNVRINLPDLADAGLRTRHETANSTTLYKATQLIQKVSPRIWSRVSKTASA